MNKIYFKDGEKASNLQELLDLGYKSGSGYFRKFKFVLTYKDPECTILKCHVARRSMDDLMAIANTYFPGSTEVDILKALGELKDSGNIANCFYCTDIHKPVFFFGEYEIREYDTYSNIQFNIYFNDKTGNSEYSIDRLIELAESLELVEA